MAGGGGGGSWSEQGYWGVEGELHHCKKKKKRTMIVKNETKLREDQIKTGCHNVGVFSIHLCVLIFLDAAATIQID